MSYVQAFYSYAILFVAGWLILLSSLYIELALVCCTKPDNIHCFGTIFPNLNPSGPYSIRPIQKLLNCQTGNDARWVLLHPSRWGATQGEQPKPALWLWVREMTWYLYTRGVRGRMKAKPRWFKVTRELCHECRFIMFGIMFMTATGLENSPQSFDVYTVSQSRSVVTSAENPGPENSPQSIGELCDGHVLVCDLQSTPWPIYKNYYTRLVRKIAWYKILMHVLIVYFLRITMCFLYWWCTKHAQLIMGTWPIYKKHFLQLI